MAAGIQPNIGQINQVAGALAVQFRNDNQAILNFNEWLTASGGATFLEGLGMDSSDASTMVSTFGNLASLAEIYQGGPAGIGLPFNFMLNSNLLWGGQ
jgi:hypothetical protein